MNAQFIFIAQGRAQMYERTRRTLMKMQDMDAHKNGSKKTPVLTILADRSKYFRKVTEKLRMAYKNAIVNEVVEEDEMPVPRIHIKVLEKVNGADIINGRKMVSIKWKYISEPEWVPFEEATPTWHPFVIRVYKKYFELKKFYKKL